MADATKTYGHPARLRKAADKIHEDARYNVNTFTIRDSDMLREAADLIERQDALIERLTPKPLTWSSERPKAPGSYLVRYVGENADDFLPWAIDIAASDLRETTQAFYREWYADKQFAGPIPMPQEQEAARG